MFGYSLVKTPDWNFDVMVGIRLWSLNLGTSIDLVNVMSVTPNLKETWVDVMVGVKSQYALTDKFFVAGWAMVGTGGSTYTWDLMGVSDTNIPTGLLSWQATGPKPSIITVAPSILTQPAIRN